MKIFLLVLNLVAIVGVFNIGNPPLLINLFGWIFIIGEVFLISSAFRKPEYIPAKHDFNIIPVKNTIDYCDTFCKRMKLKDFTPFSAILYITKQSYDRCIEVSLTLIDVGGYEPEFWITQARSRSMDGFNTDISEELTFDKFTVVDGDYGEYTRKFYLSDVQAVDVVFDKITEYVVTQHIGEARYSSDKGTTIREYKF